jgi:hypothetical protein
MTKVVEKVWEKEKRFFITKKNDDFLLYNSLKEKIKKIVFKIFYMEKNDKNSNN